MLAQLAGLTRELLTKRRRDNSDYLEATVTVSEASRSKWFGEKGEATALVLRAQQTALMCAERNSRVCANQVLRLYVPKSGRKSRDWTAPVPKHRAKYLRKAVRFAEYAGDVEEVTDHPVLSLLNAPNPIMSSSFFFQTLYMGAQMAGNAYANCIRPTKVGVSELWPMQPQSTWILLDRTNYVVGYGYGRDAASEVVFEADEVIHFKHAPHPRLPYMGMGPLHIAFREADIESASTENELAVWTNGARPDFILEAPPETTDEQVKDLERRVNSAHRGPKSRGKFMVARSVKVQPLQFTPREMEYIAGRQDIERRIWSAFGIPESEVRMNDANLASSLTGSAQYLRQTIRPAIDSMADTLTSTLLPMYGIEPGEMWFAYDNCVPSDEQGEATRLVSLVSARIITPNEARAELNYEAREGGDEFEQTQPSFSTTTPQSTDTGDDAETPPSSDQPEDQPASDATKAGVRAGVLGAKSYAWGGRLHTKDEYAPNVTDDQINAVQRMSEALKGVFFNQPVDVRGEVIAMPGLEQELAAAIRPYARQFLQAGVSWGYEELTKAGVSAPFQVTPIRAMEFLNGYTVSLARGITETTQADLKAALVTSIAQGESLAQQNVRVANALQESSGWRAERIARTETTRAYTEGSRLTYRDNGIDKERFILSAEPCELCLEAQRKYASPQPLGTIEVPVHPQCRCAIAPVVDLGGEE